MNDAVGQPGGGAAPPLPRAVAGLATTVRLWAILGGLIATGLAVMSAASALSNLIVHRPFPADYELVKHLTAVVIFTFLPYCQLNGANVTVDIFTESMSPRAKAAMAVLSAILAVAFAALLLRQMWLGWESYMRYVEVTPVLGLPLWTAFPPILVSLALLLAASLATLVDGWRMFRGRPGWFAPGRAMAGER